MRSIKLHFDRFLRAILIFMRAWMNRGKKSSARPCHPFQSGQNEHILYILATRTSNALGDGYSSHMKREGEIHFDYQAPTIHTLHSFIYRF